MSEKKKPDYIAYSVVDVEGQEKARWKEIGVVFKNKEGFTVLLDALPTNSKIVVFPPKDKEE